MNNHFELSDTEFVEEFDKCTLAPEIFNHEAHLRLAWIQIKKLGLRSATKTICDQLLAFVDHVGAPDKYNETLTIAAVKIVNHFMQKSNTDTFKEFIIKNPRLKSEFKQLVAAHYSIDIFNDDKAKAEYLEPDLEPFE